MLITCIMPTYNRFPASGHLVEESVESFLRQDYFDKRLIIVNDTPGQTITFEHRLVTVMNLSQRLPTLSCKIRAAIDHARDNRRDRLQAFCRWDDDDISLPWRLSLSMSRMRRHCVAEWRASNYWYAPAHDGRLYHNLGHANTHTCALWTTEALELIGGYPAGRMGDEDQKFNAAVAPLERRGLAMQEQLAPRDIFYLYRWGVSPAHLSGKAASGDSPHAGHWREIGERPIARGEFALRPHWRQDYELLAKEASGRMTA